MEGQGDLRQWVFLCAKANDANVRSSELILFLKNAWKSDGMLLPVSVVRGWTTPADRTGNVPNLRSFLCGSCWCWTMDWRTPSQNVRDLCLVVSMWLAQRNFPRKRVQHREEAHSRLPKPIAAEKGSMTCVLNSCSSHKRIYVQDQTHCKLEGQAYILWFSIICLRSPFTSETDVPRCSSHVIIHWRIIHTNLDFLNYSSDSSFLQAWCFRTWKRNLLVLRVFEIAWNLDTAVVWASCPVDLDSIEQVLQECWFFAACIKNEHPQRRQCDSNMFIIWMTANFNSVRVSSVWDQHASLIPNLDGSSDAEGWEMKKADIEQKAQVACHDLKLSRWKHHEAFMKHPSKRVMATNDFQVTVSNDATPGDRSNESRLIHW